MNRQNKLEKIIDHYGWSHQLRKLNEETYELFEAFMNYQHSGSMKNLVALAEEIADCKVLSSQFLLKMGNSYSVMERVEEIKELRHKGGCGYSATIMLLEFYEFAQEVMRIRHDAQDYYGWAVEKLYTYIASYELLAEELHIDEAVIEDVMDKKIERQIERIKKGE